MMATVISSVRNNLAAFVLVSKVTNTRHMLYCIYAEGSESNLTGWVEGVVVHATT